MENLLHYVWKYKLYHNLPLTTTNGEHVDVLDAGFHNPDAGPDFFNAKLMIGSTLWAGNVEIHTRSSDWARHHHQHDKAYNSVVLHVVGHHDAPVFNQEGRELVQLVMSYPDALEQNYRHLLQSEHKVACQERLGEIDPIHWLAWKSRLMAERLEQKCAFVEELLKQSKNDWEGAFYILMARSFGFSLNSDPFERLARTLPYAVAHKYSDSIFQLEALLFGQAGFLHHPDPENLHYTKMQHEWEFLRHKHELTHAKVTGWRFGKTHAGNLPHIRIAQFASLYLLRPRLLGELLSPQISVKRICEILMTHTSSFWDTHYSFSELSPRRTKILGRDSALLLIINAVVPLLFTYGKATGSEELCDRALTLLEEIKPEENYITTRWRSLGFDPANAYDSQALIQLQKEYCTKRKCLFCAIGYRLLKV